MCVCRKCFARKLVRVITDYDENATAGLRCAMYALGNNGDRDIARWADFVLSLIDKKVGKQPEGVVVDCKYVPFNISGESV